MINITDIQTTKLGFASEEREQLKALKLKIINPTGRLEVLYNKIDGVALHGNRKAINELIESIEYHLNK